MCITRGVRAAATFRGLPTIEAMRRYHIHTQGWSDIAQHLTIDPTGHLWTGRDWDAPPASSAGRNGTREAGPFMFEIHGVNGGRRRYAYVWRRSCVNSS